MLNRLFNLLLLLILLLLLVAGFVFALRNAAPVAVWLGTDFSPRPLSFWLLGSLVAGIVLGLMFSSGLMRALEIGRLRKKVKAQELEITRLKQANDAVSTSVASSAENMPNSSQPIKIS